MKTGAFEIDQIYTGDCREFILKLPAKSVTFAFADPPYWVGFDYGTRQSDHNMEYLHPGWLVYELRRVASIVCITPGIGNLWDYPKTDWIINWLKRNTMKRIALGFNHWEPVLCYGLPKLTASEQKPDVIDAPFIILPKNWTAYEGVKYADFDQEKKEKK